ncbi:hypothetical protein [Sphingopyxis fribergensis]|uniref:hypothetical protein n=1 Tax=Sphingopyxis fribergensis TaxID=1515612 RepID=UPI0011DE2ACF|nr:hypothetical protein [Sphingopyxis fribergensis]
MVEPAVGASATACVASSFGFTGSTTVRHTRLGTALPVDSTFSQTFLGFAGFAGVVPAALAEVTAKAMETIAEIMDLFALQKDAAF